jgi:DNA polymerase-4
MDNLLCRNKPIAVGGSKTGCWQQCESYEVEICVRSAISELMAKKSTQNLFFVKPRFERFKEISVKIHKIFRYTDLVEPLSLDEALFRCPQNKGNPSASLLAQEIRARSLMSGIDASAEFQLISLWLK